MFDFVNKHKRLLQVLLALLIVPPFALFGVDFYFRNTDQTTGVAQVGKTQISEQEVSEGLRRAQDQIRQMMQGKVDQAMLDSPEVRKNVVDEIISRHVSLGFAYRNNMRVSEQELQNTIAKIPQFRDENGKFSPKLYESLLASQGMTPLTFQRRLEENVVQAQLRIAYGNSAIISDQVAERMLKIREQVRHVSQVVYAPENYRSRITLADDAASKYYDSHKTEFEVPERVKLEYLVLSLPAVQQAVEVTQDELQKFYQANSSKYQTTEKRKASHILFKLAAAATAEEKAAAMKKADEIRTQILKSPKEFAELARKNSGDPGSAAKGGDLGTIERGMMVKPFENAVFSMKVGEISEPIETQFGLHLIRLDAIADGETTPLAKVKAEIEQEVRKKKAGEKFGELSTAFNDAVYDQADSLKPALESLKKILPQYKGEVQTTDWIGRNGQSPIPILNAASLKSAIFSDDVLNKKHNTKAIEAMPNILVSARVIEHKAATPMPFEQVKDDIKKVLIDEQASKLALDEGKATLDKLLKGEAPSLSWSASQEVTLQKRQGLHPQAVIAVFGADSSKLPAYAGVEVDKGRFVIYSVNKVTDSGNIDDAAKKAVRTQLAQMLSQEEYASFLASLRERTDVHINSKWLNKTQ
jgi:peptidyl-prolyl cis-trans isomerase D